MENWMTAPVVDHGKRKADIRFAAVHDDGADLKNGR
jgi:hypothetical protein